MNVKSIRTGRPANDIFEHPGDTPSTNIRFTLGRHVSTLALAMISATVPACPEEDDPSVDYTCSTDCNLGSNSLYGCSCDINDDSLFCDQNYSLGLLMTEADTCVTACTTPLNAVVACADHCSNNNVDGFGYNSKAQYVACSNLPPSGTCGSWSPSSNISFSAGTYEVDTAWLAGVANSPRSLWTCDDAYFEGLTGGYFKVHNASSGEFLYEIGLRNDDIPQTINGMSLETWNDVLIAFAFLYVSGETNYTLIVTRSGNPTTLLYELV